MISIKPCRNLVMLRLYCRPEDAKYSPSDCVYRDMDMRKVLSTARIVVHKSITTFQHLRHDVYNELSDLETVAGVKVTT
jgi:hypothetical protein